VVINDLNSKERKHHDYKKTKNSNALPTLHRKTGRDCTTSKSTNNEKIYNPPAYVVS